MEFIGLLKLTPYPLSLENSNRGANGSGAMSKYFNSPSFEERGS